MDLATINDLSHEHTAHIYAKLGFNLDMYHDRSSMCHFDTLPLRIGVDGVPSKAMWDKVPKHTRDYWDHLGYELLGHFVNSSIVLLIGGTAKETYMRYLRAKDIDFERIRDRPHWLGESTRPWDGLLQFDTLPSGGHVLSRIAICVSHPRLLDGTRAFKVVASQSLTARVDRQQQGRVDIEADPIIGPVMTLVLERLNALI
jgi:hypothetical protein